MGLNERQQASAETLKNAINRCEQDGMELWIVCSILTEALRDWATRLGLSVKVSLNSK